MINSRTKYLVFDMDLTLLHVRPLTPCFIKDQLERYVQLVKDQFGKRMTREKLKEQLKKAMTNGRKTTSEVADAAINRYAECL